LPRPRLRRPLRLSPRGAFTFTPKTVSIDVTAIMPGPGRKTLHVGRTKGAVEYHDPYSPPVEVDLVRVVALLGIENERRREAGEPLVPTLFDPRLLRDIRQQAKALVGSRPGALPFEGRPRVCFETTGAHPGESLWMTKDANPEIVIESRAPVFDDQGQAVGTETKLRSITAEAAAVWLAEESQSLAGTILDLAARGGCNLERRDPPREDP
jgi:hypothetical protein